MVTCKVLHYFWRDCDTHVRHFDFWSFDGTSSKIVMQGKNNFYRPGWACEGRNNGIEEVFGHLWTIYTVYSNSVFCIFEKLDFWERSCTKLLGTKTAVSRSQPPSLLIKKGTNLEPMGGESSKAICLEESHVCVCCGSILSLVQIFFSFVSNSLSCYYHTLPYAKTKEKKIWTKDKIEPQHVYTSQTRPSPNIFYPWRWHEERVKSFR